MVDIIEVAVGFTRVVRGVGIAAPPDATTAFAEALAAVGLERPQGVYWAGRTTLVRRPEDIARYDRAFAAFFGGGPTAAAEDPIATEQVTLLLDDGDEDAGGEPDEVEPLEGPLLHVRWSDRDVLRDKDFAACSIDELDEAHRLMADLRLVGATRPSRRLRPSRRARGQLDLHRTTREALRRGGETLRLAHRRAGTRPRRVVLICDVSGSMEPYSRALVRFAQTAVVGRGRVEVFALGTRLTRLTRELSSRDPDAALDAAAAAVEDWSGGTRLGEGLRTFNERWGLRGMARGATVVILSDGWDRGDPQLLSEQLRRLRRVTHRLVWVNPLKGSAGYAPLARGMAAALPWLDEFVEGHSMRSLEELAAVIST
jgi:uncharacterized protein with von Willebrand factor type A (vWA) domain